MEMPSLYLFLDPYLIWFYRLTGQTGWNFLIGTSVVAVLALMVGEFTSFLASLMVRRHFTQVAGEAKKYQDLSMEALKAGDRPAYEAANKLANDAFNKSFFMQLALSATFFWPIFFMLGWMQERFQGIEIPLVVVPYSLGFVGIFIILYALAYFLFKRVKYRLPYFRRIKGILDANNLQGGN
ncbi:MAG: hypothetical protein ACLQED_11470 [Desulfobaccales bacterium]